MPRALPLAAAVGQMRHRHARLEHGSRLGPQTERQQQHVYRSTKAARLDGITHLLHIDDELLVCPRGSEALRRIALEAGPEKADLHCLNIEALVPIESDVSCANPFREARRSDTNQRTFVRTAPTNRVPASHWCVIT